MVTKCPNCENKLKVPDEYTGKKCRCPKCENSFVVPGSRIPSPQEQKERQEPESTSSMSLVLVALITAALAGVIGFSCGALLTRTSRQETKAKILAVKEEANREIEAGRSKLNEAENKIRALNEILQRNQAKITRLVHENQEALGKKRQPSALEKSPYASRNDSNNSTYKYPKSNEDWEIVEIKTKITETNNVYVQYAWILTVKNNTNNTIRLSGKIEYQDSEGFIVDTDDVYDVVLSGNRKDTFTGATMVDTSIAHKIDRVIVKLKQGLF